jgi:hypothetical protein
MNQTPATGSVEAIGTSTNRSSVSKAFRQVAAFPLRTPDHGNPHLYPRKIAGAAHVIFYKDNHCDFTHDQFF